MSWCARTARTRTVAVNGAPDHFGETRLNAFGPRLGIAYQIDSKTVIRTGSAIYYQPSREDGNADNGIQGFGATIVQRVHGDYFAVMGLPLQLLVRLLERVGILYAFGPLRLP